MSCGTRKIVAPGFCGNIAPATPCAVPATCETLCPEDHTQQIVINKFNATLITRDSWNVPACNESTIIVIEGLTNIEIGSYLWNSVYGYFKVVGFSTFTSEVTVENLCYTGNAVVGTQIPECTDFIVTDPPAPSQTNNTSGFPYVAQTFTAPDIGDCIDISVTTTNGLIENGTVQISTGMYQVTSVSNANIVTICNLGDGITPGTVVVAQNGAGEYQYRIALVSDSPCEASPISTGSMIVCNGGDSKILTPTSLGQVPVVVDVANAVVSFEDLDVEYLNCTTLLATFTIVAGTNSYVLTLSDTSTFLAGMTLEIEGRTERFGINTVIDLFHVQITMYPIPGANASVSSGAKVCVAPDCADSQFPSIVTSGQVGGLGTVTLNSGTTTYTSSGAAISLVNTSKCRGMSFGLGVNAVIIATISGSTTNPFSFNAIMHTQINALTPFPVTSILKYYNYAANTAAVIAEDVNYSGPIYTTFPTKFSLAPQASATLTLDFTLGITGTIGAAVYNVTAIGLSYVVYGLAG